MALLGPSRSGWILQRGTDACPEARGLNVEWKHHRDRGWLQCKSIPIPLLILLVLGPPLKERRECQQYVSDASTSMPRNALPENEKYRVNALFVQFYGGLFQDILPILPVNPDLSSTSRLHPAVGLMEFERRKVLKETNTCVFLGVLGSVRFCCFITMAGTRRSACGF